MAAIFAYGVLKNVTLFRSARRMMQSSRRTPTGKTDDRGRSTSFSQALHQLILRSDVSREVFKSHLLLALPFVLNFSLREAYCVCAWALLFWSHRSTQCFRRIRPRYDTRWITFLYRETKLLFEFCAGDSKSTSEETASGRRRWKGLTYRFVSVASAAACTAVLEVTDRTDLLVGLLRPFLVPTKKVYVKRIANGQSEIQHKCSTFHNSADGRMKI